MKERIGTVSNKALKERSIWNTYTLYFLLCQAIDYYIQHLQLKISRLKANHYRFCRAELDKISR
jgi:hypothetical protein